MTDARVLVLGTSGMLGSMVTGVLCNSSLKLEIYASGRDHIKNQILPEWVKSKVKFIDFDLPPEFNPVWVQSTLPEVDWVINCIGITKPFIAEDDAQKILRALSINSIFPYTLDQWASKTNAKVLQIGTDCVFSGSKGLYKENSLHEATDVYGKTKSLGEPFGSATSILRSSIIGPELSGKSYLLEWFLSQPAGSELKGFLNHLWNGVTTYHFGKVCLGIISKNSQPGRLQHLIPDGIVNKYELLKIFSDTFLRSDLKISAVDAGIAIDRTLATNNQAGSDKLWHDAGYKNIPTVRDMVAELKEFISDKNWK